MTPLPPPDASPDVIALRKAQGHKYDHGHALVLSGGPGRTGAARLAAHAALRIGAGAVTLGVPPAAQMEVATQITALMLARVPDGVALRKMLGDARYGALCLGPGLGIDDRQADLVAAALDSGLPCVLDADALTLIGQHRTLFSGLHGACVLTPHLGEFQRVFPQAAKQLEDGELSKAEATRAAAQAAGCVVLLKGAETVMAAPGSETLRHIAKGDRAVPWLATAGAGDVLTGFIAGLLARGLRPLNAAANAAWLHAECALQVGPGLIAEDLADQLPVVFRQLGL